MGREMIKRDVDQYFELFYQKQNKALLVTGARQTGKTFSIRRFGNTHFDCFDEINFINSPEAVSIFSNAKDRNDLLLRLSAYTQRSLIKGKTLIFFDEVQECKDIVTAIKVLVEEGSYRYILSGSLLGVELNDLRSVPVGYMDVKEMFPLDFKEFIEALGIGEHVISSVQKAWEHFAPVDEFIHHKLMDLFRLYLIVGGMPAAVQKYLATNNLREVMFEQRAIIRLYKKDISKYDKEHKFRIEEIFDLIPPELNAKNKRFILKNLNENVKFSRYENSFLWLSNAGVALPVYNIDEPVAPLKFSRSRNLFKLFQNDIGLLASQYADGIQLRILNNDRDINFGSVYENVVAQELHAHGFDLYYFNSKKQGELDFVIERNGVVLPVEVKSGKDYFRHNALNSVMQNADYGIPQAFVLCNNNVEKRGKIVYLPMYMLMFVRQTETAPALYKIDLAGLQ
jgi:predicted AAA+ superfamily ATPase